jgi:hypothetical protein
MKPIALVTARSARDLDEDLAPLAEAVRAAGAPAEIVDWDDPAVDWSRFRMAVLRSTWDYTARLPEFLEWVQSVERRTVLCNPSEIVAWSVDKHYLADLAGRGVDVVPSRYAEPGADAAAAVARLLEEFPEAEMVIKPSIGAGSRDAQRYGRGERDAMVAHVARLLGQGRSVLLQPYQARVDAQGETGMVYYEGHYSHAFHKGALLQRGSEPTRALFAPEKIGPRTPDADELTLGGRVLGSLPFPVPLYARIDLVRGPDGSPRVLELELAEPSMYFPHAPGSATRFAAAIIRRAPV